MATKASPTVYVVGIDATPSASHVLAVASTLGSALRATELHLVHVVELTSPASALRESPLERSTEMFEAGRHLLEVACQRSGGLFHGKIAGHIVAGDPWREITQTAANLRADLIVVGTSGRAGIARVALGSVAEKVVRKAGCPVLVVRPKDYDANLEPGIEPPCPDCLAVQTKTHRAKLWCERHTAHRPHGRLHYEFPPTFALGSMNFRP